MLRPLTLASMFALAFAATLPACGGGGEACTTCQAENGGTSGGAGKGGTVGTAGTGVVTGHGGTTGAAGSTPTGTAGTIGTAGTTGTGGMTGTAGAGAAGTTGRGGTTGTGGMAGTAGTMGVAGTTGRGGTTGTGGMAGTAGAAGMAGTMGMAGTTGMGGMAGTTGMAGMGGMAGTTGMAGMAGTGVAGSGGMAGTTGRGGTTGTAGTGGTGGTGVDPDLVLWYMFDDASGTTATDSSGHNRSGTLTSLGGGSAAFSTTNKVPPRSLNLTSTSATVGGYVSVPASMQTMGATTAVTISMWVYIRTARQWARVFDFGNSSTTGYMFITVQQNMSTPNSVRLAISKTTNSAEEQINMTTPALLSTGAWHHLAVTLGAGTTYTGTLYLDKVAVGSNAAMTLRPSDLGNTTQNWIGRSQFSANDALFDGFIDDLRIYKRALTAAEITALP